MTGPRAAPALLPASVAVNGMVVGATLDQAVKQLPARHRIGVLAFGTVGHALVTAWAARPGSAVTATEVAGAQRW